MAKATVALARWELVEIIDALRVAGEDGKYDDDKGLASNIDALERKLKRAIQRAK